ncbi:hypothetical protein [Aliiglaciecola sp. M165]|uniref:hypothetical protein n=1 Tax=Aliiglaciecola sp. M165 TaxID=2593649 RepID=UPI00117F5A53|nr:hypothetical protein [Aliiglaciecola sp. M165]TRY31024.1 hypothetical protein FM019_14200 [Aliiglaciecola sp. M165]
MIWRLIIVTSASLLFSGCSIIEKWQQQKSEANVTEQAADYCIVADQESDVPNNCDLRYWLAFWVEHDSLRWTQRRDKIDQLGDSPSDTLKKVLLSQGKGTPYQDRLRAQGWADDLLPKLSQPMRDLILVIIYQPSQQLLEFESALTILTRINTNQSKELDAQKERLLEQQQQIEQLLKIEASMMQQTDSSENNERNN